MEVCQNQHGHVNLGDLVQKCENGRNQDWRKYPKTYSSFESYNTKGKLDISQISDLFPVANV